MKTLCEVIKEQVKTNFINLETAIKTYDRNASVCGAPAWRYVYHTIHSADKWFINPFVYSEPAFHEDGMDNPDSKCSTVLSDRQLFTVSCKKRLTIPTILPTVSFTKSPKTANIQDWNWYWGSFGIYLFIPECLTVRQQSEQKNFRFTRDLKLVKCRKILCIIESEAV